MNFHEDSIKLASALNAHQIQWAYGGSSLLYYLGIPLTPRDLDVVIAKKDIEKACGVLQQLGAVIKEEKLSDDEFLTEKFYTLLWGDIEIDLMAMPGIRQNGKTFVMDFDAKGPWKWVEDGSVRISLSDPEDWLIYYGLMRNREHRVTQLNSYLLENQKGL